MAWKYNDKKHQAVWDCVYPNGRDGEEMLKVVEKFEARYGVYCYPQGTSDGGFEIATLYPEKLTGEHSQFCECPKCKA